MGGYTVVKLCPAAPAVSGVKASELALTQPLVNPNIQKDSYVNYKETATATAVPARAVASSWTGSCGGTYGLYIPSTDKFVWSVTHDKVTLGSAPPANDAALKAAIIAEHNRIRANPTAYAQELETLKADLEKANASDSTYAAALKSAIEQLKPAVMGKGGELTAVKPALAPAGAATPAQQTLAAAAQAHATWLVSNSAGCNGSVHNGPIVAGAGGGCKELNYRLTTAKYPFANYAENVTPGGLGAKDIVRGFIVDSGSDNATKNYPHRKTILSADYTEIGVGVGSNGNVVVNFGKPKP
jgi:uncharacterized protein YkwD